MRRWVDDRHRFHFLRRFELQRFVPQPFVKKPNAPSVTTRWLRVHDFGNFLCRNDIEKRR